MAAVFAVSSDEGTGLIHASVTLSTYGFASSAILRSFLGDSLPVFAVPTSLTIRADFPRTTSGKIDRMELAAETQRLELTLEKT